MKNADIKEEQKSIQLSHIESWIDRYTLDLMNFDIIKGQ